MSSIKILDSAELVNPETMKITRRCETLSGMMYTETIEPTVILKYEANTDIELLDRIIDLINEESNSVCMIESGNMATQLLLNTSYLSMIMNYKKDVKSGMTLNEVMFNSFIHKPSKDNVSF